METQTGDQTTMKKSSKTSPKGSTQRFSTLYLLCALFAAFTRFTDAACTIQAGDLAIESTVMVNGVPTQIIGNDIHVDARTPHHDVTFT